MDDKYRMSLDTLWEIRRLLSDINSPSTIYQALKICVKLNQNIDIAGNEVRMKDEHSNR